MVRWSYQWLLKQCRSANHRPSDSVTDIVRRCRDEIVSESMPHFVAWLPYINFAPFLTSEIVPVAEESTVGAWERVHLLWRYQALKYFVFLERQSELVSDKLSGKNRGRLRIGVVECQMFNDILMTLATATVLGETVAAKWFAEKCDFLLADQTGLYARPDLCSTGPVEPFMFHLVSKWRGRSCELEIPVTPRASVFRNILSNWDGEISDEVHALLELHATKVRTLLSPDEDLVFGLGGGLNFCLPFEVYFLVLVREQRGLSIPQMDHPIVQVPLADKPRDFCRSGFDPLIQLVVDRCKQHMEKLSVPWEVENQSRPARDWQARWTIE